MISNLPKFLSIFFFRFLFFGGMSELKKEFREKNNGEKGKFSEEVMQPFITFLADYSFGGSGAVWLLWH